MKSIIILDGLSIGKTNFIELAKSNNYWCWNVNKRNVLSFVAHKTGWDGIRTKEYFEFLDEQEALVNKYFNFEVWYWHDMIKKFEEDKRVQLLIIHNCREEVRQELIKEFVNCSSILIVDESVQDDTYTYSLNCKSPNYNENILDLLSKLGEQEQNAS
jgi:hypothetical protein